MSPDTPRKLISTECSPHRKDCLNQE